MPARNGRNLLYQFVLPAAGRFLSRQKIHAVLFTQNNRQLLVVKFFKQFSRFRRRVFHNVLPHFYFIIVVLTIFRKHFQPVLLLSLRFDLFLQVYRKCRSRRNRIDNRLK